MTDARLNEDGLVLSSAYAETMRDLVLPWLEEHREKRTVPGFDGKPLAVSRFDAENPRGTVILVHGFTSCVDKFDEIIFSLLRNGWSVLAYDQRGHGYSWRDERISDPSLVHVEHFEDYVRDLESVCEKVLTEMPRPWVLFCHSMGGAVSGLFLEKHPQAFERAVFCSPMIAPQHGGVPLFAAKGMCIAARKIGKERERIFLSRPYAGPEDFSTSAASGKERFDWYSDLRDRTPAYHTNGPTYQWSLESLNVTEKLLAPGAVERIAIPVQVYGAENDGSVLPEPQQAFADRLPNGSRKVVSGARHEIYRSPDAVLFPWWHEILAFYGQA